MESNPQQQSLDQLLKIQGNEQCFECAEPTNEWVSVNNGIFLCEKCAILHKKFGPNVSTVQSITQDSWSDTQIAMVVNGGNLKLKNFFEKYFIPKEGPTDFKYRTKAGYHYRDILKALSEGKIVPDPIDAESALEIEMEPERKSVTNSDGNLEASPRKEEEKKMEKISNYVEKKFDETVQKTKETAAMLNEKLRDPKLKEDMKQGVLNLVQETKNVATMIGNKVNDPDFRQNVKDVSDKLADGAKKSVMGALGFLKRMTTKESTTPKKNMQDDDLETVYSLEESADNSKYTKINENKDSSKDSSENLHVL